jgi:hypothetical protein
VRRTSALACPLLAALLLTLAIPSSSASTNIPDWASEANKTPTPAYAKDSEAVILYDEYVETIDARGRATEREREAIRILKPQGRHHECGVSYDVDEKINYFRVWTIAADGKQYQAKETDFIEQGDTGVPIMLSTGKTRVAHPPAVDVGATVICESEELMAPYFQEKTWRMQTSIPFVSQALEIDLPPGRTQTSAWHRFKPVPPVQVAPNHFRWELKDTPAFTLRDIPSHPEWEALAARMSVQWGDAAIDGKDNQWRAIGQWVTTLQAGRPDPSPEITAKTQELIAGAPDFYTRLSRITQYVQNNIRYFIVFRGIGGWQANHAADIFRNRYGDCKDKSTILISMLQAAGIHAFYVLVDVHRGFVDPDDPSIAGDHMITAIELPSDVNDPRLMAFVKAKDGKRYLIFDPTNETVPVGNLPNYEQGSFGTLSAGPASQILPLPILAPEANLNQRTGTFTLAADGSLTGSVATTRSGMDGADLRYTLKSSDEKERRESLEKSVAEDVPSAILNSVQFLQPPELDKPIELKYSLTAAQYAHQAGPLLLVRPRVVGSSARPFDDKPRTVPIDLGSTGKWRDSFDIAIPAGYVVDDTPDPVSIDLDFASYHSSVSGHGNLLHYESEYVVKQIEIPAEKAAAFRHLQGAILASEKGTAVLKKQ